MKKLKRPSKSRFFPLEKYREPANIGHGRIEQRHIALLPCEALSEDIRKDWDTIASIGQITRIRQHVRGGIVTKTETETNYVISRAPRKIREYGGVKFKSFRYVACG